MHAGEHHLTVTGSDEFRHLGQELGRGKAAIRSSRLRDDAVGTAGVATVLDLHEGPGVPGKCGDRCERRSRCSIERRRGDAPGARLAVVVEMVENPFLFPVAEDKIDLRHPVDRPGLRLGKAACRDQRRPR